MTRPLLLAVVGNTHTRLARLDGGRLADAESLPTRDLAAHGGRPGLLAAHPDWPVLAACVVPEAAALLRHAWPGRHFRFLDAALAATELDLTACAAATVGADRLANAVAGLTLSAPPFLVVDCGTAISTAAVDDRRRFRGGAILPGRSLWRRALKLHTAQLPEIELQEAFPPALGTDTRAAILAGCDAGVLGAVRQLVEASRHELDAPGCPVFVTGGGASFFLRHLGGLALTPAPADFTLRGLARLAPAAWPQTPPG
ncbi:MAG: type III pantothenate kinase [Lentisphaeria bacterium]